MFGDARERRGQAVAVLGRHESDVRAARAQDTACGQGHHVIMRARKTVVGRVLGTYGVARLYVNFFQPSFKLKHKKRHGAKVRKTYHAPATPCGRLLKHPNVSDEDKERLREQRAQLDPVDLLHTVRPCQETLAQLAGRTVARDAHPHQVDDFVRALPPRPE